MACNNSGVWNEEGAFLDFSIAPSHLPEDLVPRAWWARSFSRCSSRLTALRVQQLRRQEKKTSRCESKRFRLMTWTALPDGSVDFVNRQWREYTGLSVEQTAGSGWQTTVHPEDLERHLEKWRASLGTGQPFESEVRFRCGGWQISLVPCAGRAAARWRGKIVKWYGTSTDIEEREREPRVNLKASWPISIG